MRLSWQFAERWAFRQRKSDFYCFFQTKINQAKILPVSKISVKKQKTAGLQRNRQYD